MQTIYHKDKTQKLTVNKIVVFGRFVEGVPENKPVQF
jgi:hypothetical protein